MSSLLPCHHFMLTKFETSSMRVNSLFPMKCIHVGRSHHCPDSIPTWACEEVANDFGGDLENRVIPTVSIALVFKMRAFFQRG